MEKVAWAITHQKLEPVINPDAGGYSQQWNVGYLINSGPAAGVRGEIHVPPSQLSKEIVHPTIQAMVDRHTEVASTPNV
jgi:hypothetical protein